MNWVDLLIAAVIAWTVFRGLSAGLIRQAVMLLAVVLGIVLAGRLYDDLAANLDFLIDDQTTRELIAFVAIAAGVMVAGSVLAAVLKTTASMLMLGPLDRLGGAVLGLLRGLLYVQLGLIALAVFPVSEDASRAVDESTIAPLFLDTVPLAQFGLPDEFNNPLQQLESWRETLGAIMPEGFPDALPAGAGPPVSDAASGEAAEEE
jgi:membrane protein required for colicin V production